MLIDLHAHPDLKLFYFHSGRDWERGFDVLWRVPRWMSADFMPITLRTRIDNLVRADVRGRLRRNVLAMGCTVALPEPWMRVHERSNWPAWAMQQAYPEAVQRMNTTGPFTLACEILVETEHHAEQTTVDRTSRRPLAFAHDLAQLKAIMDDGRVALFHGIEGSVSLYDTVYDPDDEHSGFPDEGWPVYEERLHAFARLGVRQITTSHHYESRFMPQCENTQLPFLASDNHAPSRYRTSRRLFRDPPGYAPLIVETCCNLGMLVDLSHASPEARWESIGICESKNRPPIISHGCVRGPQDRYQPHPYACSDQELRRLHAAGGMLGLILSNCRLAYRNRERGHDRGLHYLIAAILHIREVTGDVSIIGIGSDFDGGSDPMDDCRDPRAFPRLVDALRKADLSPAEVDAITVGNALRTFERGWSER